MLFKFVSLHLILVFEYFSLKTLIALSSFQGFAQTDNCRLIMGLNSNKTIAINDLRYQEIFDIRYNKNRQYKNFRSKIERIKKPKGMMNLNISKEY